MNSVESPAWVGFGAARDRYINAIKASRGSDNTGSPNMKNNPNSHSTNTTITNNKGQPVKENDVEHLWAVLESKNTINSKSDILGHEIDDVLNIENINCDIKNKENTFVTNNVFYDDININQTVPTNLPVLSPNRIHPINHQQADLTNGQEISPNQPMIQQNAIEQDRLYCDRNTDVFETQNIENVTLSPTQTMPKVRPLGIKLRKSSSVASEGSPVCPSKNWQFSEDCSSNLGQKYKNYFDKFHVSLPEHENSEEARRPSQDIRPDWAQPKDDDEESDFDEAEYLRGRIPLLRQSVDRELPPREYEKKKVFRERAPWERPDPDDPNQQGGFQEDAFLKRHPPIRPSEERDNSMSRSGSESRGGGRKMVVLRRSESRDRSPSKDSNYSSGQEDEDQTVKKMEYKGGAIPSKAFARLQKMTNRMATNSGTQADNMQRLRDRARQDSGGIDIDDAIDKLQVEGGDPEQYMQNLKKSMQQKDIKIEAEADVTDF